MGTLHQNCQSGNWNLPLESREELEVQSQTFALVAVLPERGNLCSFVPFVIKPEEPGRTLKFDSGDL